MIYDPHLTQLSIIVLFCSFLYLSAGQLPENYKVTYGGVGIDHSGFPQIVAIHSLSQSAPGQDFLNELNIREENNESCKVLDQQPLNQPRHPSEVIQSSGNCLPPSDNVYNVPISHIQQENLQMIDGHPQTAHKSPFFKTVDHLSFAVNPDSFHPSTVGVPDHFYLQAMNDVHQRVELKSSVVPSQFGAPSTITHQYEKGSLTFSCPPSGHEEFPLTQIHGVQYNTASQYQATRIISADLRPMIQSSRKPYCLPYQQHRRFVGTGNLYHFSTVARQGHILPNYHHPSVTQESMEAQNILGSINQNMQRIDMQHMSNSALQLKRFPLNGRMNIPRPFQAESFFPQVNMTKGAQQFLKEQPGYDWYSFLSNVSQQPTGFPLPPRFSCSASDVVFDTNQTKTVTPISIPNDCITPHINHQAERYSSFPVATVRQQGLAMATLGNVSEVEATNEDICGPNEDICGPNREKAGQIRERLSYNSNSCRSSPSKHTRTPSVHGIMQEEIATHTLVDSCKEHSEDILGKIKVKCESNEECSNVIGSFEPFCASSVTGTRHQEKIMFTIANPSDPKVRELEKSNFNTEILCKIPVKSHPEICNGDDIQAIRSNIFDKLVMELNKTDPN